MFSYKGKEITKEDLYDTQLRVELIRDIYETILDQQNPKVSFTTMAKSLSSLAIRDAIIFAFCYDDEARDLFVDFCENTLLNDDELDSVSELAEEQKANMLQTLLAAYMLQSRYQDVKKLAEAIIEATPQQAGLAKLFTRALQHMSDEDAHRIFRESMDALTLSEIVTK